MARRSEHTQEEIRLMVLNAAETIVVEEGMGALKVRNIAMEIGYTIGSIYMVFQNMADLTLHIKGRTLDDIANHLQRLDPALAPEQCLLDLSKAYLEYARAHFNRWQMLFEHRTGQNGIIPEWYQEKVELIFRPVEIQFQRLKPSILPEQAHTAARALWGGVHGICFLSMSGSLDITGVNDVEATVALMAQSFIRGWQAE